MASFQKMDEDYINLICTVLDSENPYLSTIGLNFRYLCVDKQPEIIKITRANPLTNYIAGVDDELIFIILHDEAFRMLDSDSEEQKLIIANSLNNIEFNSESGKTTINNNGIGVSEGLYLKYKNALMLALFNGQHAVKQLEQIKRDQKQNKKDNKKNSSK